VQECGEAAYRRKQMRDDAKRAAECGDHTRPRAARQSGGKRVDRARAGRGDDDKGRDQKLDVHAAAPTEEGNIGGKA